MSPRQETAYSTLHYIFYSILLFSTIIYATLLYYSTLLFYTLLYYSLSSLKLPSPQKLFIQTSGLTKQQSKKYVPRTQMTHILEDLTHKMESQPPKRGQLDSRYVYKQKSHKYHTKCIWELPQPCERIGV